MDFVHIEIARQLVADRRRRLLQDAGRTHRAPIARRTGTRTSRMGPVT